MRIRPFFNGTDYVWKEVAQSIPAADIPEGYENYQVFSSNLLIQSSDIEISPPDAPKVRMQVGNDGTVFSTV